MSYLVVTKWVTRAVPKFGTIREPALAGLAGCNHVTDKQPADGDHILCHVECDAATAAKIEQQGLGVVLWEKGKGDPDQKTTDAANAKLAAYGLAATIQPGTKDDDAERKIKTKIKTGLDTKPVDAEAEAATAEVAAVEAEVKPKG